MAMEVAFGNIIPEEVNDQFKILSDMLDPKNIEMKTEIHNPVTFAVLDAVAQKMELIIKKVNEVILLPKFTGLLKEIIEKIKVFMVSYARKSRKEIQEILQGIRNEVQASRSFVDRLINTNVGR